MQQQQRRAERCPDEGLVGQRADRVEQRGGAVRQVGPGAAEEIKLVGGAGHEDQRLHDVVGLEGAQQDADAVGAVELRDVCVQRHAAQRSGQVSAAPMANCRKQTERQRRRRGKAATELREAFGVRGACSRFTTAPASWTHSKRFARQFIHKEPSQLANKFDYCSAAHRNQQR